MSAKADDCVSRHIPEIKRAHPDWKQDQVVAVALSKCGQSNKGGVLYAELRKVGFIERLLHEHRLRARGYQLGLHIKQAADGLRYMELVTSNGYRDRDNETITTKALREYVERGWIADDVFRSGNTFKFWHKYVIGDIVWADMDGPFLIEYAKERPGSFKYRGKRYPVAKVWDYIEAHPEAKWGASHGFRYESIRVDMKSREVIYDHIRKFESSVLPLKHAANPFTHSEVIHNGK